MNEGNAEKLISAGKRLVWHPLTGIVAADVCLPDRRRALQTRPLAVVALMPPLCIATRQRTKAVDPLRLAISDVRNCFVVAVEKDAEEITA